MAKFEIKNRWTGEVQFETELSAEIAGNEYGIQLGFAVKKAAEADAYLTDAYLTDANLTGANLTDANLAGAYLTGAYLADANLTGAKIDEGLILVGKRPYFQIDPIGSESRQFIAYITDKGLRLRAGCFFGTRDEFIKKLARTHGDNEHAQEYRAALSLIDEHVRLWTPAVAEVPVEVQP